MTIKLLRILTLAYLVSLSSLVVGDEIASEIRPANEDRKITVMELDLSEDELNQLKEFDEQIDSTQPTLELSERGGKSFKDASLRKAADALTDDEITEIIKSISFPNADEITEDSENHEKAASALPDDVEPRATSGQRQGRGYFIVAFTPEDEGHNSAKDSLDYARLQIIPAERSMDGDMSPGEAKKSSWNKYINRLMRQIRRGTRKIQRKTRVKSHKKKEPTVENFLKDMYKLTKKQQKKKTSSWFFW